VAALDYEYSGRNSYDQSLRHKVSLASPAKKRMMTAFIDPPVR
jgi:hypothetical protein